MSFLWFNFLLVLGFLDFLTLGFSLGFWYMFRSLLGFMYIFFAVCSAQGPGAGFRPGIRHTVSTPLTMDWTGWIVFCGHIH